MAKEKTAVTRGEAIGLYNVIANMKSGKLSKDAMIRYIPLRVRLKALAAEYETMLNETREQTKPEGYDDLPQDKQGELQKSWSDKIMPVIDKWMSEPYPDSMKVFSMEEAIDFLQSNPDIEGQSQDFIFQYFVKDTGE